METMETIVPDIRFQVHACLRYLASHRDGEHDGFKRVDAPFGKQFAEMEQLTLAHVSVGAKLIRRYRRQLEAAQFRIPAPREVAAYLALQQTTTTAEFQGTVPSRSSNRVY